MKQKQNIYCSYFVLFWALLKFLGQLLGQSRLFPKKMGRIDPDF